MRRAGAIGGGHRGVVDADALVRQGCYVCLQEAVSILERQVSSSPLLRTTVAAGLVQAGICEGPGKSPGNRVHCGRAARGGFGPAIPTSGLAACVAVSAACEDRQPREALDGDAIANAHPDTPLLTWRLATCTLGPDESLAALMALEPRWHESAWYIGRASFATSRDVRSAAELFVRAAQALPDVPGGPALAGRRTAGTPPARARAGDSDRVLTLTPTARPALLGCVICLTHLGRHAAAVATATTMIELGAFLIGDARNWRAWNHYQLGNLAAAEADAEQALRLVSNTNACTLAGVVKHDLKKLDEAEELLTRAREMDSANFQAIWYLGRPPACNTTRRWRSRRRSRPSPAAPVPP